MRTLVQLGADCNMPGGKLAQTPLQLAVHERLHRAVGALLSCGAHVNYKGAHPLADPALHLAAKLNDDQLCALLLRRGADVALMDSSGA